MRSSLPTLKIPWYYFVAILVAGGSLYLTELSGRITILGNYNVDGIRNLLLLGIAVMATFFMLVQGQWVVPNFLRIWPYLLLAGWGAFSLFWTIDLEYTLRELPKLVYPIFVYMIAAKALRSGASDRKLLELTRNIMAFFALIGVAFSMYTLFTLLRAGHWEWGRSRLLNIPLQWPALVSSSYIVFDLAMWWTIPGWRPRKLLMILLSVDVMLSLTRAYIFAFVAAVFVAWGSWGRSWRRLFLGTMLGTILVAALLVIDNPIKDRMFWRPQQVTIGWLTDMVLNQPGELFSDRHIRFSGRFGYWGHVLSESHAQRPALIGAGLGSSRPLIMNFHANPALVVHSDFVSYLAELGYVGLGLFLLVWISALLLGLQGAFRRNTSPPKRAAAIILVGYVVLNILAGLTYNPSVHIFIFHSVAMILVAILTQRGVPSRLPSVPSQ